MPRTFLLASAVFAVGAAVACTSSDTTTAPGTSQASAATLPPSIQATVRVRCELRLAGPRSKISVDGNNLSPLNAVWRGGARSGGASVGAPAQRANGDEVEFDFSSDPADIAQGATPIPGNFIKINPNGPDVFGAILDVNGNRVAVGSAECAVR